jgi:hypothetical protein
MSHDHWHGGRDHITVGIGDGFHDCAGQRDEDVTRILADLTGPFRDGLDIGLSGARTGQLLAEKRAWH